MEKEDESVWCSKLDRVAETSPQLLFVLDTGELADLKTVLQKENEKRRKAFLSLMEIKEDGFRNLSFINNFSSFMKVDVECICKHLLSEESREKYIFKLGKLLAAGKVGEAFLLRYNDSYFILKSIKNMPPKTYLSLKILSYSEMLWKMNPGVRKNEWIDKRTGERKILAAGGDSFSNQTCLHMILNTILKNNPNYVYQYDAFYCDTGGYNITEFAMKGDLSAYLESLSTDIDEDFLQDMLKQVLTPLSILKADLFSFVHADLKARNVFVNLDDDNKPIYQIADFDKSSIFWKGVRFYNQTGDYRFSDIPFEPQEGPEGSYYIIESPVLPIMVYTMHNPFGFYLSYDVYTFIYSLMMEPVVWRFISRIWKSSPEEQAKSKVFSVWKDLWYIDQFEDVMISISKRHQELKELEGDEVSRKAKLADMRSIRVISNKFQAKGYKLKIDISSIYRAFDLRIRPIKQSLSDRILRHTTLDSKRICLEVCRPSKGWRGGRKCKTNRFSKKGIVYNWDWC